MFKAVVVILAVINGNPELITMVSHAEYATKAECMAAVEGTGAGSIEQMKKELAAQGITVTVNSHDCVTKDKLPKAE